MPIGQSQENGQPKGSRFSFFRARFRSSPPAGRSPALLRPCGKWPVQRMRLQRKLPVLSFRDAAFQIGAVSDRILPRAQSAATKKFIRLETRQ